MFCFLVPLFFLSFHFTLIPPLLLRPFESCPHYYIFLLLVHFPSQASCLNLGIEVCAHLVVVSAFFFKGLPWCHAVICSGGCSGLFLLLASSSVFHYSIRIESGKLFKLLS